MKLDKIIKRDGREVSFDATKIAVAITKAFNEIERDKTDVKETALELTSQVIDILRENDSSEYPTVEYIQDVVERILIENNQAEVAKAYILYRAKRNQVREAKLDLVKTFEEITFSDVEDSDIKRENANINGATPMGAMLKYGSESSKYFYVNYCMKPEHARAHKEGYIHVHDMDFAPMGTLTCCQIDLIKLFKGGFNTGHGHIREPNSISTYSALACIAIQSNQNCMH